MYGRVIKVFQFVCICLSVCLLACMISCSALLFRMLTVERQGTRTFALTIHVRDEHVRLKGIGSRYKQ